MNREKAERCERELGDFPTCGQNDWSGPVVGVNSVVETRARSRDAVPEDDFKTERVNGMSGLVDRQPPQHTWPFLYPSQTTVEVGEVESRADRKIV